MLPLCRDHHNERGSMSAEEFWGQYGQDHTLETERHFDMWLATIGQLTEAPKARVPVKKTEKKEKPSKWGLTKTCNSINDFQHG